ncbi:MAG: ABC transporter permease [Clostridiaceae bacterium]|nr:ABC transporter permease [Clostridiaceae bacterium]
MLKNILKKKEFTIFLMIIIFSLIVTVLNSNFLKIGNFVDIAKGNVVYGIMAFGMLVVLISGGIDLSVPANITLSSVICGELLVKTGLSLFPIILVCIVVSGLVGLINGILITKAKLPPFVATLGVNSIIMGLVLYYTRGSMITGLPEWFRDFGVMRLLQVGDFNIPIQVVFYIVAAFITYFVLRHTVFGRGVYAVGGNPLNAARVGYNVDQITILIYVFSGFMMGLAAVVNTSVLQGVNPNTYAGVDMTVISIAVIGGASTLGGVGSVLGTVLGTLLMGVLQNGLIMAKISSFWQEIIMGIVILVAVSADIISRKREQAKLVHVDVDESEEVL